MKNYVKNWIKECEIDNIHTIKKLIRLNNDIYKKEMESIKEATRTKTLKLFNKLPLF